MNRPMTPEELMTRICQDRQVVSKSKQGFSDPLVKKRHDKVDFDREIDRIFKECYEL